MKSHFHFSQCKIGLPICLPLIFICFALLFSPNLSEAQHPTQRPYVIKNKQYFPIPDARGFREQGIASWYGTKFHGRRTSNGERYNMHEMTAAHKTLPMNTMVLVQNLENGRKTVVRINDRGPFVRGRIIDLSYRAASRIGMDKKGIARVRVIALAEKRVSTRDGQVKLVYRDPNVGEFYVQIGAFTRRLNAIRLQKRFSDVGHTTVIQTWNNPATNHPLYRVQVYVGRTLRVAKKAEQAILEHGWQGSFVIAR